MAKEKSEATEQSQTTEQSSVDKLISMLDETKKSAVSIFLSQRQEIPVVQWQADSLMYPELMFSFYILQEK